jgi:hypothetical protein
MTRCLAGYDSEFADIEENGREELNGTCSEDEVSRFLFIVRKYATAAPERRRALREVIVDFLKFSPNRQKLITEFILTCIALKQVDRLEIAIDVLSELGERIQDYTNTYLMNDIQQWHKVFPRQAFKPNDDYWYVLLRSIGRCESRREFSCALISVCQDEQSRGVAEAVVEALGDLGTASAKAILRAISSGHSDMFIRDLANETIVELSDRAAGI